ncbi:hypothetical protein Tco_1337533 [Tanacetum coccineum]
MAARGGRNNIVARRVIDDLIDISGERSPPKYLKIFIEQQITDHRRFIARMRDEIRTSTNLISQLNALIEEFGSAGDYRKDDEKQPFDENGNVGYEGHYQVIQVCMLDYGKPNGKKAQYSILEEGGDSEAEINYGMKFTVKSAAAKMVRSKSIYQHTMRRGGYTLVKEKMIEKKKLNQMKNPRVVHNKDGEYPYDEIRSVGDKLDKIKEGTLKVDHGTDAMTVVLGKEIGGYARGVGSGVTYKRYFDLPQRRQASDERILLLQSQLYNERRERQEKELLIQNLSNKMSQTEGMVTKLKNQLAAHGGQSQSMSTQLTPPNEDIFYVSSVDINPINNSADDEGGTTIFGCENDASI